MEGCFRARRCVRVCMLCMLNALENSFLPQDPLFIRHAYNRVQSRTSGAASIFGRVAHCLVAAYICEFEWIGVVHCR